MLIVSMLLLTAAEQPINLVCSGEGHVRRREVTTGVVSDGYDSATVTSQRSVREIHPDQVYVELNGDSGRIRVPAAIKPPLRAGGEDGWWPMRNVSYSPNEIRGRFSFNFMNRPSVRLDRLTGRITIRGMNGNFDGACEAFNPEEVQRRF